MMFIRFAPCMVVVTNEFLFGAPRYAGLGLIDTPVVVDPQPQHIRVSAVLVNHILYRLRYVKPIAARNVALHTLQRPIQYSGRFSLRYCGAQVCITLWLWDY